MSTLALVLLDDSGSTTIEGVSSFVGEDASGSFGILPGHARFITVLVAGLARFRRGSEWSYLAMPGAALYFLDDVLTLGTRRYVLDTDYARITATLAQRLLAEERSLRELRQSLRLMEQQMRKKLWDLARLEQR
jgi:F-type H+-transporting ATPase subunit epsilon